MQFAGQRTSLDLEPLGDPVNLLVKLNDDTLPSPGAILTTKILPQDTLEQGITEPELAKFLSTEVFTPDTIILGFNSVRFDDKFIQHLFWRNFYDPYEWQWKDGRSRWDMLDVVRMTRALRPNGINWPVSRDGKPTNRLELITKENGISHESAHDALSDVNALIDVTRLIRSRQPKLFDYLFKLRDKREVKALVDPTHPTPFVYSSGRYGSKFNFTTVAYPLFPTKNGNIAVFDLRENLDALLEKLPPAPTDSSEPKPLLKNLLFPTVKEFAYNRCPAVAPLGVLKDAGDWERLALSKETVEGNLQSLLAHPEVLRQLKSEFSSEKFEKKVSDPESSLYDSFTPDPDKPRLAAVRSASANDLADFHPNFIDERLPELLLHYKAKNFPTSLTKTEEAAWESYRSARLARQTPPFLAELKKFESLDLPPASRSLLTSLNSWFTSITSNPGVVA